MKRNAWLVRPMVLAVSGCFGMSAYANPLGPQVTAGGATFQGLGTGNLQVTTTAPRTIINWQGFSIGAGQITNFLQPAATSAVLNRVGPGGGASHIDGSLLSNGRVFLINPAGIVVGATGVIDTAGFVGSTLNMLDADFLAGKLRFSGDASAGSIDNQGMIRTSFGGSVVLIAPHIENGQDALIQTPGGELILAAGQKVSVGTLDPNGVQFEVQAPADSVVNLGRLIAQGGAVGVFAGTLKHSGDIRADALVRDQAGNVVLKAQGDVALGARSVTSATGRIGGDVTVVGNRISVAGGAVVNVSGDNGGGRLRIGGDYQGRNPSLPNASTTTVESGASLSADAITRGDGGRIIVWSEKETRFEGAISAHGGSSSGNGGFAEVSGHETLNFGGAADLGASRGALGTLLLDPLDLYVRDGGGQFGNIVGAGSLPSNAVTVAPATLAAVNGNVSLFASRYMLIGGAINLTTPGQALTAEVATYAPGAIPGTPSNQLDIAQNITTAGGAVTLTAPSIQTLRSSTISTGGGAVSLSSTADTRSIQAFSLNVDAGSGAFSAASKTSVQFGTIAAGNVAVNVPGFVSTNAITASGPVSLAGSSVFTGVIASGGAAVDVTAATGSVSLSGVTAGTGNVTLTGPTGVFGGTIDTAGAVKLTASSGTVSARVNNASSLEAASSTSASFSSASVSISSDTAVNATALNATATGCTAAIINSCAGASVTVNANGSISVGNVSASAPVSNTGNKSASVSLTSATGAIGAASAGSQIKATDVTLRTGENSGGGIGTASLALNADVERRFTFAPNGAFNVLLNGSGPNAIDLQPGVAAAGQTYTGTLARSGGGIDFAVSASDTTVTVPTFTIGGFNQSVFNSAPSIALQVPNGALVASNVIVPQGDTNVPVPPAVTPATQPLSVTIGASGDLTVNAYTRQSTAASLLKSTRFFSDNGSVTLGTIAASRDSVSVSAQSDVSIASLATAGSVNVSASAGNIAVGQIDNTAGSSGVALNAGGKVGATADSVALEVLSAGPINISANTIGESTFANPLDLAAPAIALTSQNFGGQIGFAGKPVVANTAELTINAADISSFTGSNGARFNVSTGASALRNLTVTANPAAVGTGGSAQVRTEAGQPNDRTYSFASDGTNFSFGAGTAPATQFASGTLNFTSNRGNIALADSNMGPTGALALTALNGSITGSAALDGRSIALSAGTGTPGAAVTLTTGGVGSVNTDSISLTAGASFGGSARTGSIQTGALRSADSGSIDLTALAGNIDIGPTGTADIGASGARAGAVAITSNNSGSASGTIRAGDIVSSSVSLRTLESTVTTGNVDATGDVTVLSHRSVTTGDLDATSITISNEFFLSKFPQIAVGTIGAIRPPWSLNFVGQSTTAATPAVTIAGPVTGAAGSSISITGDAFFGGGAVSLGGPVVALAAGSSGGGATITINHDDSSPLRFTALDAAAGGTVALKSRTGIEQTSDAAGGGITADTVTLIANNGTITNSADPAGRLDLNTVRNLRIDTSGSVALDAHGNTLASANITKNRTVAAAPFELANLGSGQAITLSSAPTDMTLVVNSPSAALDFTLKNNAGGIALGAGAVTSGGSFTLGAEGGIDASAGILTGGATGGGAVSLTTSANSLSGGNITAGTIDTTPTGTGTGGSIAIRTTWTPGNITLNGDLRTGPAGGPISVSAEWDGDVTRTGTAAIVSEGPVSVVAQNGNVGSAGTPLLITSNNVTLSARDRGSTGRGFAFATLGGTSNLTLTADNGFNVASDTAFTTLSLNTRGSGTGAPGAGALNLTAPGQIYAFDHPTLDAFGAAITGTFQVLTVGGASPPANATFFASSGDLLVTGGASLTASTLTLGSDRFSGSGDVILQGSAASPLTLDNATQTIRSPRDLRITGRVSLNSNDQTIGVARDLTAQARDGSIALTGVNQNISSDSGTMSFLGGSGADEGVTVSASAQQRISTSEFAGGDAIFRGGSGDRSTVTVVYTGPNVSNVIGTEEQLIQVRGNVVVGGGAGANSDALITTATGDQLIRAGNRSEPSNTAIGNISVLGGAGAGSDARITNTGSGYQQVGESRFTSCGSGGCGQQPYQSRDISVRGGAGAGALAEITATGPQQVYSRGGTVFVTGGDGAGANAKIESTATTEQRIGQPTNLTGEIGNALGALNVSGGAVGASTASVNSPNAQRISASGMFTVAGGASGSTAAVTGATQEIRTGGVAVSGGSGDNAAALVQSAGVQALRAFSFLNAMSVAGGAGAGSSARINSTGSQTLSFTSLAMTGGAGSGAFAHIDTPSTQTLSGGSISLAVQGTSAAPVSNAGVLIEGESQSISGSAITLSGGFGAAGATSDAIIRTVSGNQSVSGSSVTLKGGGSHSTTTIVNGGSGTQALSASGGITLSSPAGADASAPVLIQNSPATTQIVCSGSSGTCFSATGPVRITNNGGAAVAISSGGNQIFNVQSLDVSTAAGSTGNSSVSASGTQWIHTSNFSTTQPSMRVAALGSGAATIESASTQLLEVDYPDVMAPGANRRADLVIGDSAAVGTSQVRAVDQSVFAGALVVQSGTGDGSVSKLAATGTQAISLVSDPPPAATPPAPHPLSGITVAGGSGSAALATIDPTLQTIVSNGPVDMTAVGGPTSLLSSGPQTFIVTNGPLNLTGSSPAALATINTTAPASQQVILASGGINVGPFASIGGGAETAASSAPAAASANQTQRLQDELDSALYRASGEVDEENQDGRRRQAQICR